MHSVREKSYKNGGNPEVLAIIPSGARAVLDVGCGAGDNAAALFARGMVVDGITLSEKERASAGRYCRNVFLHNLEEGLPATLAQDYDCTICSHVLEHICWPERLLADISKKLKSRRGILVVALPNFLFYENRWRIMRGRFIYETSGLMDNTHFRWYTFESARRLLEQNGFIVEEARGYGSFPLWLFRRMLGPRLVGRIDAFAARVCPGLFSYQMVYVARSA